jgi:signal transduction histidine kinase
MPLVLRFARADRPAVQRMLRAPQRHGPGPITVTLTGNADTDFRGALRCVSVRADRVLWVLDDVSATEGARELQERAMERERAASEQLRATDSMRRAFLLGVSHDLRVPLAAIAGFASVLRNAALGIEERQRALVRLEETAYETVAMLDGLLDYERIDQPTAAVHRTRNADISAQVALAADAVGTDGHTLRIETDATSGNVDLVVVERIVSNLVRNAVQHTPAGTTISVRCSREPDGVLLVVEDDGPGIAPERRESVFNLFERAHESSGIGAGLALVRRFARLHGGYARLEERPGGGASFQVLLDG